MAPLAVAEPWAHALRRLVPPFAIGVAYWLLPQKRSADRPLGYHEHLAWLAAAALNLGLFLRVVGEVAERSGNASDATFVALGIAAVLQIVAAAVFVLQLWPRVGPRAIRQKSA